MENFHFLPTCCYHPSTVLMIDDNLDLLKDISFALSSGFHKYKSKYSTAPQEIIDILTKQGNMIEQFIKKNVSISEEYFDPSKTIVNIDIPAIHQEIYMKPIRFSQYIVLVVDYAMPDMNGLELCQVIRRTLKLPVKIIMLTGEADQMTAIQAFNNKLIDRFVVKSSSDYIKKILTYLHELHTEYFEEITHVTLESSSTYQNILRKDPVFIEIFNQMIHQYKVIEYYLLDESGSFLLLDANKHVIRLIVKTEEDMQFSLDLAVDDRSTPANVLQALKKKEKLTYFPDEKSTRIPAAHWHLWDAKPLLLSDKNTVYYAIIEGVDKYSLNMQKLISYHEFLNIPN